MMLAPSRLDVRSWIRRCAQGRPGVYAFFRGIQLAQIRILSLALRIIDVLVTPIVVLFGPLLRFMRRKDLSSFPISKYVLLRLGVFPIINHYYEPLFDPRLLRHSLRDDRQLPGVDLNIEGQLEVLRSFDYRTELLSFPIKKSVPLEFAYDGGPFMSGDSEYLYCLIRMFKPKKIIEVGAGHSTLMIRKAIASNVMSDAAYICDHVCIEPYEADWLDSIGIRVIRERVECLDDLEFRDLADGDILFIDSSHVLRPQGDVLFLFQRVLPTLKPGVFVHIHDIFTPRDYLDEWIRESTYFWNEQYLLEAFLCSNPSYRVVAAMNFLKHHYPSEVRAKFPILDVQFEKREPGSFWIRRN
jgi:predicted O-methyltransferase YrrM